MFQFRLSLIRCQVSWQTGVWGYRLLCTAHQTCCRQLTLQLLYRYHGAFVMRNPCTQLSYDKLLFNFQRLPELLGPVERLQQAGSVLGGRREGMCVMVPSSRTTRYQPFMFITQCQLMKWLQFSQV